MTRVEIYKIVSQVVSRKKIEGRKPVKWKGVKKIREPWSNIIVYYWQSHSLEAQKT